MNKGEAAERSEVSGRAEAAEGGTRALEGPERTQHAASVKGEILRLWSSESTGHVSWAPA